MEEKLLETIVSAFVSELVKDSKNIFKEFINEGNNLLKIGIKKYLDKQKNKYSYLKTLLRGNTPVYLYDIYYPLKLTKDNKIIETDLIENIFTKSNYITIIGDAGSGKSTLVKHLFLNSIYTKFAIPLIVELRYLNDYNNNFETYIFEKILENKIAANYNILERLLDSGKFIFFLDGYDELSKDIKKRTVEEINSFVGKNINNKFILTSRPFSDIESMPLFHNYSVRKLSFEDGEIQGFVFKQLTTEIELAKKIIESINTNNDRKYIHSFLTNPLLLSLYILTFQSNASIPNKKYIFYRRVINALFSEHDSKTKLGFVREKISGLDQEQFEDILKKFCFISFFESKFNWDADYINSKFRIVKSKLPFQFDINNVVTDLKSAVSVWVEDNGIYSFAHRSLQEYFAALLVANLNDHDKKRMYEKIIDKFSSIRSLNEVENFLSLLEELDSINFKRYYLLPLLYELREELKHNSDEELAMAFINFFASGVILEKQRTDIKINDKVFKSIYVHINYTLELNEILRDGLLYIGYNRNFPHGQKPLLVDFKNLNINTRENCIKRVTVISTKFNSYINETIAETERYIQKYLDDDKEIVDII